MSTATSRRPSGSAPVQGKRFSLGDISTKGNGLPPRTILHGVEGVGKTSFAAYGRKPVFIQTKGETGLETLIDANRIPETAHFPECGSWIELLSAVSELRTGEHDFGTLVIDTLNGAERLCHEHVCVRDFKSDWGKNGFTSFMQGFEVSLADWAILLQELDALRAEKKMTIICLCHTKVQTFANPEGADFDRYQPDLHRKTWGLTAKWADMILFANFETFVDQKDSGKKGKGTSAGTRVIHTERHAAYDAKNRFGLPLEIEMGSTGKEAFDNFKQALIDAKGGK